jgi:hypothetical protein
MVMGKGELGSQHRKLKRVFMGHVIDRTAFAEVRRLSGWATTFLPSDVHQPKTHGHSLYQHQQREHALAYNVWTTTDSR